MTLIEAFASGLPIVASRLGTLAEVVEDGLTGRLFSPGDSNALSTTVNELINDPQRLGVMCDAARRRYLATYTPETNLDELTSIYLEAIEANRPTTIE